MRSLLLNNLKNIYLQTSAISKQFFQSHATRNICAHTQPLFAGHSKWANIKHIKAEKDHQKAVIFQRMARQIRLAIQDGGSADPALNSQLKNVIELALRQNMPMASIQQNIKRSTAEKQQLKKYRADLRYKQKVFLVCNAYTDNIPQLKMDMATILRKGGAVLIDDSHLFEDFGLIQANVTKERMAAIGDLEDAVTTDAIESGADDVEVVDATNGAVNFICKPEILSGVQKLLEGKGYLVNNVEHMFTPHSTITLSPDEKVLYDKFVEKLKGLQGVEDIFDNVEYTQ